MTTFEELDKLSSRELHDRAVKVAEHGLDVKFFWEVLKTIPAAEVGAGHLDEAEFDVASGVHQVNEALHQSEGQLADALRPVYIDYLLKHSN